MATALRTADRPQPSAAVGKTADAGQLRATTALLNRASSIADTAAATTGAIADLLERYREQAGEARSSGDETGPDFKNLGAVISQLVRGATFDGVNLLDGSQTEGVFRVPVAGEGAGELALAAYDLKPGGGVITLTGDEDPAAALEGAETSLANLDAVRGGIGEDAKRVEAHRRFVGLLADVVGREAPSASLDVEGARLAALQLRQSLSGQGLSIANGGPQTVLSLFR